MVVDHPSGLHECVADGWPDKLEPAPDQVFTQRFGLCCFSRNFRISWPGILLRTIPDETPQVNVKTTKLLLDGYECLSVGYR